MGGLAHRAVDSLTVLSSIVLVAKEYGLELPERRVTAARTFSEPTDLLGVEVAPPSDPAPVRKGDGSAPGARSR